MDVELVAEGASEDDAFNLENNIDDYTAFDGERCGICMDIVIDRGVLDCCQHWFCFTCIDNWATITNLCPLCQNELQSITCVPVYDTIGSSKVDEDLCIGEDDWCIEGKNNTLSFPSYYIDENAVICLDGDGCKIRSGSVTIEEDSNLDTSIACDSCDIWYHAFCVGFDPEGTCENSWLCPRCIAHENPQKSDLSPALGPSTYSHLENATNECLVEAAFSGKVSVSVADAGETAVVISMIDGNQVTEGQSEKASSTLELDDDVKIDTIISSSMANGSKSETPLTEKTCTQPVLEAQELDLGLSQDSSFSLTCTSLGQSELKELSSDKMIKEPTGFHGIFMSSSSLDWPSSTNEPFESSLDLHLGISVGCSLPAGGMKSDLSEDKPSGDLPMKSTSEELPAGKIVPDRKDNVSGNTPSKRKLMDSSDDIRTATVDEETEDRLEPKASTKKLRVERDGKLTNSKGQTDGSVSDESQKCNSEMENDAYDIMSIVQGTSHRTFKAHANNNHTEKSSIERQNAAGLRVKKIMRRAAEDKDSSMLVQKLRKEIRDAVHNRSPEEFGENLFDPKLLAAFRTAVAGSVTEPAKISPALVVKAKKLMLQKGKVRENLTKKIYGIGGRRKRAWTRDCEIEFWKHRCLKAGKPEKIETLKSVLNVLRKSSNDTQIKQATEGMATNSILSRLYLADTSVFPRKDDIKPLSDLKSTRPVENKGLDLMEKVSTSSLENHTTKTPEVNKVSAQAGIPSSDQKGNKNITGTSVKDESAYNKAHPNKCLQQPSAASLSGSDVNSQKGTIGKSTNVKKDKRKWALEILARKTAATGSNATQAKEADNAILKGNYPLLAQLPVDMRPVMAPSRHNKVPMSVRQAQLYRLTEHFLRKANLPVIRRTADTELAVADAVNIEKEVADRSNSKLVYVNLMSQELLHRADNVKYGMAAESEPSSTSTVPTDRPEQVTSDLSDSPIVEEALRNAGLLADSPPNSPSPHMDKIDDENNFPEKIVNKDPDNVFEMDSHPELDIYGDFEYDLEDEDFIGASALRISSLQQEESKMKVVFSTISSDQSNNAPDLEGHEQTTNVEAQKTPSCLHDCSTDMSIRSSSVAPRTEDGLQQHPVINEGGEEPSAAECEELYGPEKEPLMKRFPDSTVTKPSQIMADDAVREKCEDSGSNQAVKASESRTGSCIDKLAVASVGHHASAEEHETGCSQTSENGTVKEKPSNTETKKESDSFNAVSKKVEAYIKEHIRPLCKSGVITSEQYRWAVGKTTEKVMKYHTKEKDANFLIKEGEKVKKLAEQYVEAAQKMKRK